jgi:hypothetical protein
MVMAKEKAKEKAKDALVQEALTQTNLVQAVVQTTHVQARPVQARLVQALVQAIIVSCLVQAGVESASIVLRRNLLDTPSLADVAKAKEKEREKQTAKVAKVNGVECHSNAVLMAISSSSTMSARRPGAASRLL